jgi:hypothetical protein
MPHDGCVAHELIWVAPDANKNNHSADGNCHGEKVP